MRGISFAIVAASLAIGCVQTPYFDVRLAESQPAPPGITRDQGTFAGAFGDALYRQSWHGEGKPRGALIVIHGIKDHGDRYSGLALRLAADGFAVHAMDLRGHGRSSGNRAAVDDFDEYLEDLDRFVEYVRGREGGVPLFVFGHSMGGAITTKWAITRNPKIGGIVLSAPGLRLDVGWIRRTGGKFLAAFFPNARLLTADDDKFSRDPAVVQSMKDDPFIFDDAGPAQTGVEFLGATSFIDDHMEELEVPFLALHGTADELTEPDGSRDLYARAASKDKTLLLYDGDFHDLVHEPDHEKIEKDVQAWLEKRAPIAAK